LFNPKNKDSAIIKCPILNSLILLKYAFVLAPLAELNPEAIHPLEGTSYQNLWKTFQSKQDYNMRQYNVEKLFE